MKQPVSHKPASARKPARLLSIDSAREWRLMERLRGILAGAVETLHLEEAILLVREPEDDLFQSRILARAGHPATVLLMDPLSPTEVSQALRDSESATRQDDQVSLGPYRAGLLAALEVDGTLEGVIAARTGGREPDPVSRRSLQVFAAQAAYAVEAARADARHEVEALHQETLFEVARTVSSELDSAEILRMVAELMAAGVESSRAAVYIWKGSTGSFARAATHGMPERPSRSLASIKCSPSHPYVQDLEQASPLYLEPDDTDPLAQRMKSAVDSRRAIAIPLVAKGELIAVAIVAFPRAGRDDGRVELLMAIAGQAALAVENARLYEAQNQVTHELAGLYAVSHALAAAPDLESCLRIVAESIATILDVSRCAVFLVESGYARGYLIIGGTEREAADLLGLRLPLSERETAMMAAVKNGAPTVIERSASRRDGYVATRWRVKRMAAVPLINRGRTIGLAVADEPGRLARFSPRALRMAGAIGEHAALMVHNARLHEQTRRHADDLLVLWEIGEELSGQTDESQIVSSLLTHLHRLPSSECVSIVMRSHAGGLAVTTDIGTSHSYESADDVTDPCDRLAVQALETLQPALWRTVRRHDRALTSQTNHAAGVCVFERGGWQDTHAASALSVPIVEGTSSIGAITLFCRGEAEYSSEQVQLARSICSIAGSAVRRARLYDRERRVAETLQRSFLPELPESLGAFDVADRYAAALQESRVGGDFYDIFPLPGGRVGLVIGDVSGKGLGAAIHTATAKYTIRAYAYRDPDPAALMAAANDVLCFHSTSTLFITLFYGYLDLLTGELVYANAGHEPPLHYKASGDRFHSLAVTGRAIGFLPDALYMSEKTTVAPGDSLVLFTDGITEARSSSGTFFDPAGVREAARGHMSGSAATIADRIESRVQEHTGGEFSDDYALIVIRRSW